MKISRLMYAPKGASEEMEIASSDLLPVSNLWCIARNFARKIQWIYATSEATYAIFADPETYQGFEALCFVMGEHGEGELECKIVDLDEYIATSEHEFKSERDAVYHLSQNWGECLIPRWEITE